MRIENDYKGFISGEMDYFENDKKIPVSFPIHVENEILLIKDYYGTLDLKLIYLENEGVYLNTHYWDIEQGKWKKVSFEKTKRIKILEKINVNEYIKRNFF